jgi:hypothetical protein
MPRPTTPNRCNDAHEEQIGGERKVLRCTRGEGHAGTHSTGSITWPRRLWSPPSVRPPAPPAREPRA